MNNNRRIAGALLAATGVFVLGNSYIVKRGDTLAKIAKDHHSTREALVAENHLSSEHPLKAGMRIDIPHKTAEGNYTVKSSDNDWIIAHHHGITVHELHSANPGIHWNSLQAGMILHIPGGSATETAPVHLASSRRSTTTHSGNARYTVSQGECDWTIASKLGIKLRTLHELNPGTNWNTLRPGQHLEIPGGSSEHESHRITTRYAVVNADNVVLRRHPSTSAEEITTVNAGELGRVESHDNGWYQLKFPKGTVAWVKADLLIPTKHHTGDEELDHVATYTRHYASHLRRREGRSSYTSHPTTVVGGKGVISTALAYRGTPYVWGGTSRGGFDCSGFTSSVFRKNGVDLPRTSREQAEVGKYVPFADLRKGDLVFFHTMRSERINHVGIYIGNGKFVHASSGGGEVKVSSINEGYYRDRFVEARQVLPTRSVHKSKGKAKKHHG